MTQTHANPSTSKDPRQIRGMFGGIAGSYDRLNRLLSFRQDQRWRRRAAAIAVEAVPAAGGRVLDVCCGTGDLALALHHALQGRGRVLAADFTPEMLLLAQPKAVGLPVDLLRADTLRLPFADDSFDACTVGWGIRNVAGLEAGIAEMRRVVKPGGRVVILESTQPRGVIAPFFRLYFTRIMPAVGNCLSRSRAYSYLQESVYAFPDAPELKRRMEALGFARVEYHLLTLGTIAVHVGIK